MANYSEAIKQIASAVNEANRIKADDKYRQDVLRERVRSNQENEAIRREDLANRLMIQGAYGSRAADTRSNLERQLDTTERGQDLVYDLGITKDTTARRGQDISRDIAYRGQDVTMRGQDITQAIARMRDKTTQRGQDFQFTLGKMGDDTNRYNIDKRYGLGLLNITSREEMQDKDIASREKMQRDEQDFRYNIMDKDQAWKTGEAAKDREYRSNEAALDRSFQSIMTDKKITSAEKTNAANNLVREKLSNRNMDIDLLRLDQQMTLANMAMQGKFDEMALAQQYEAMSSAAEPEIFQVERGMFGLKEGDTIDKFARWHDGNKIGLDGGMGLINKAKILAKQGPNEFTQAVIDTYEDAFKKLNQTSMRTTLDIGSPKKKIKNINQQIKTTLKPLYNAQGYTEEEVKQALKNLKARF